MMPPHNFTAQAPQTHNGSYSYMPSMTTPSTLWL